MKLEFEADLLSTFQNCTILGKIFYFWTYLLTFIGLLFLCIVMTGIVWLGHGIGFIQNES